MLCLRQATSSQRTERTLKSYDIVLASGSPRRKELFEKYGLSFVVEAADIDEEVFRSLPPKSLTIATATAKGDAVASKHIGEQKLIISADTVVYRKKLYGKPSSLANAVEILSELTGRWHSVFTGVSIIDTKSGKRRSFAVRSLVRLKKMAFAEINEYVEKYRPLDKAGAYAIQENCMVKNYIGDYENIIGLPMKKLIRVLDAWSE